MDDHFDLLDSEIYGTEYCITYDHSDILNTKQPDKELEYFWLTFKNSIIKCIDVKLVEYIKKISDELNELQKIEKYDDIKNKISEFMNKYIESICKEVIAKGEYYTISHLETNINRWTKYDNQFSEYIEKLFFVKASIIISKIHKKNKSAILYVIKNIVKLQKEQIYTIYTDLFEYAVKNNMSLLAELVAPYINFNKYVNETDKNIHNYKYMKGLKLIKFFKKIL